MQEENPAIYADQVEPWMVELWRRRKGGEWPASGVPLHQVHALANEVFHDGQAYDPAMISLADGGFPLPLPIRIEADSRYRGRGTTIAVMDDSFVLIPDLADPRPDKIRAFLDCSGPYLPREIESPIEEAATALSPHGTSCAAVAAGSGILSGGFYRGLADEADLILLQMSRKQARGGGLPEEGPGRDRWLRAFEWIHANKEKYGIRVLCALCVCPEEMREPDCIPSHCPVTDGIGELIADGITVILPAGNQPGIRVLPVRWAEDAITVGGVDDMGRAGTLPPRLIAHSYGYCPGGYPKPDVLAPAKYVPLPDVPGFPGFDRHSILASLRRMNGEELREALVRAQETGQVRLALPSPNAPDRVIREAIERELQEVGVIRHSYRHGGGTAPAAAAVAGLAACLLEADPSLSPRDIKAILTATATYYPHLSQVRQGAGVVNGRRALAAIERRKMGLPPTSAWVDPKTRQITFTLRPLPVPRVLLAGDFNGWNVEPDKQGGYRDPLQRTTLPGGDFVWQRTIGPLPKGWYGYKFLVGDEWWLDPDNPATIPSGLPGGIENSLLRVFL